MNPLGELVAERIRMQRLLRGLRQEELAELAGLSSVTVSNIERKINSPSIETLQRLLIALEISPHKFFSVTFPE